MIKRRARKFNAISDEEKLEIFNQWQSGNYYQKELLEEHRITRYTLALCIEDIRGKRK